MRGVKAKRMRKYYGDTREKRYRTFRNEVNPERHNYLRAKKDLRKLRLMK